MYAHVSGVYTYSSAHLEFVQCGQMHSMVTLLIFSPHHEMRIPHCCISSPTLGVVRLFKLFANLRDKWNLEVFYLYFSALLLSF